MHFSIGEHEYTHLTPMGRKYVLEALTGPPARSVGSFRGSKQGRFAGLRDQESEPTESRHLEFCHMLQLERDPKVRAIRAQAPAITPIRPPGTKIRVGGPRIPDLLVFEDHVRLLETKPEETLKKLAQDRPEWYFLDSANKWHFLPMELAARELGIEYSIVTERDINPTLCENVLWMWPFLIAEPESLDQKLIARCLEQLRIDGSTPYALLAASIDNRVEIIHTLIAHEQIYVDIHRQDLTRPQALTLFSSRAVYNAYTAIVTATGSDITEFEMPESLAGLSLKDLQNTVERHELIAEHLRNGTKPRKVEHNAYRYYRLWTNAVRQGKSGWDAIASKESKRGKKGLRIGKHILAEIKHVFDEKWEDSKQISTTQFWGAVQAHFKALAVRCPDKKTIDKCLVLLSTEKTALKREGWVGAYKQREYYRGEQPLEPHGTRLLEVVHIDHKLAKVILKCSRTGITLGFAWITLAFDAFCAKPVAFWYDYNHPCAVSVLMVLRDFVLRYGRLPTVIVVDNGAEFHGTQVQAFCAKYGVHLIYRGPRQPGDGGIDERFHLTLDTEFFSALPGYMPNKKDDRQYDPRTDPHITATHTIGSLYDATAPYLFQEFPNQMHTALGCEPQRLWDLSARETGLLELPGIPYTTDFHFDTMPFDTRQPTRVIDRSQGISVFGQQYWNPIFRRPGLHGTAVEMKYDPPDPRFVFAHVDELWYRCVVDNYARIKRLTNDKRYANIELRRRVALSEQLRGARAGAMSEMHDRIAETIETQTPVSGLRPPKTKNQPRPSGTSGILSDIARATTEEVEPWNVTSLAE